jgi:putative ABC transport system permease protein
MKLLKTLKHAFNMVIHSKLRSWLTIIGIVIGVASVIAIVSLGEGMQSSLTSQLGDLGGDIVTLTAGYSSGRTFGPGRSHDLSSSSGATEEKVVIDT